MKRMAKKMSHSDPSLKRFMAALVLVFALTMPAAPARAIDCEITADPANLIHWITELANWATSIANQIFTNFVALPAVGDTISGASIGSAQILGGQHGPIQTSAQGIMDSHRQDILMQRAMVRQGDATLAPNSLGCANHNVTNASIQTDQARRGIRTAITKLESQMSQGAQANAGTMQQEQDKDDCQLKFKSDKGRPDCPGDPNYANVYNDPSRVTTDYQFKMPVDGHISVLPDGLVTFPGADNTEKDWIAAYKFCEHLGGLPTPSPVVGSGGKPTSAQFQEFERHDMCVRSIQTLKSACLDALVDRTACPSGATVQAPGGASCHDIQLAMCKSLKNAPNVAQGGLGIDPNTFSYLKNCESDGLSWDAARSIRAFKCGDSKHLDNIAGSTGSADKFESDSNCQATEDAFMAEMAKDKDKLQKSYDPESMARIEEVCSPPNAGARLMQ